MDLETFVESSLVQIAEGLRKANACLRKSAEADGRKKTDHHFSLVAHSPAADRTVEFDVAVTASAKGHVKVGGKARLLVADATADGTGAFAHERVSRVRFRVQVEEPIS
jgi:hypothetical protein